MDRGGGRRKSLAVRDLRRVFFLEGYVMDGTRCGRKPPLEVQREFTTSRLEVQVLTQAYELIVSGIRRPTVTTQAPWDRGGLRDGETPRQRVAQGA